MPKTETLLYGHIFGVSRQNSIAISHKFSKIKPVSFNLVYYNFMELLNMYDVIKSTCTYILRNFIDYKDWQVSKYIVPFNKI